MLTSFVDVEIIQKAVRNVADLGFERLSISGGEPLLYPHLKNILIAAREVGMSTSLVTNGSFPQKKYEELVGLVDIIGVSLDGKKELHNEIRQKASAYDKVERFLDFSQNVFSSVGIIYSLSDQSWEDVPEMLDFGKEKKVNFFQIHPIEEVGRAKKTSSLSLTSANLKRAYILTKSLSCQFPFPIQMDVLSRDSAIKSMVPNTSVIGSDTIDLLVMNEKGEVLPYTYGIDPEWRIADLRETTLMEGWDIFMDHKLKQFEEWCRLSIESEEELLYPPSTLYLKSPINQTL
jgi:Fe-coproporphyrin III synthase